jgi:hypothetical protein
MRTLKAKFPKTAEKIDQGWAAACISQYSQLCFSFRDCYFNLGPHKGWNYTQQGKHHQHSAFYNKSVFIHKNFRESWFAFWLWTGLRPQVKRTVSTNVRCFIGLITNAQFLLEIMILPCYLKLWFINDSSIKVSLIHNFWENSS